MSVLVRAKLGRPNYTSTKPTAQVTDLHIIHTGISQAGYHAWMPYTYVVFNLVLVLSQCQNKSQTYSIYSYKSQTAVTIVQFSKLSYNIRYFIKFISNINLSFLVIETVRILTPQFCPLQTPRFINFRVTYFHTLAVVQIHFFLLLWQQHCICVFQSFIYVYLNIHRRKMKLLFSSIHISDSSAQI